MSNLHLLCISLDKDRDGSNILNVNDKPGFCKFLFRHMSHSTIETPFGPHRSRVKMRNLLFESGNSVVARQTAAFRHFKSCESALKKDKLQSETLHMILQPLNHIWGVAVSPASLLVRPYYLVKSDSDPIL